MAYQNRVIKARLAKIMIRDENDAELTIGRAQSLIVKVENDLEEIKELTEDGTVEIVEGSEGISGSIKEVMINFNLLNKAMRDSNGNVPYMTLSGTVNTEQGYKTVVVSGVKLKGWNFEVGTDKKKLEGSYDYVGCKVKIV